MEFNADTGANDSKNYLKLKDGDSVKGLLAGKPYEFQMHWVDGKGEKCSQDNLCSHCALDIRSKFRFRVNFIVKDGAKYTSKIFEQGGVAYNKLKDLSKAGYKLENHLIQISRSGSGQMDTEYSIVPLPEGKLGPDQLRAILSTPLIDLAHKSEPTPEAPYEHKLGNKEAVPAFNSDEEIPF